MENRASKILQLLENQRTISVSELSTILQVSKNTIRMDLQVLANKGLLVRTHGGAELIINDIMYNSELTNRINTQHNAKQEIAKLVLSQLPKDKHFSLFFDSSTSGLEVSKMLVSYPRRFTAITHFNNIAVTLGQNPRCSVVLCGGAWWHNEQCTLGQDVINTLQVYKADVAIIGCTGIHQELGITNGNIETVEIKKQMVFQASNTWLLCDHSKFDTQDLMQMFSWDYITKIFTNKEPSKQWKKFFLTHNIELYYTK